MKVLFFVDTPHRMGGAQRSLLALLGKIRAHGVEPLVVFPAGGLVHDAAAEAGLAPRVVEPPEPLMQFDQALLRLPPLEKAHVVLRHSLPYSVRIARLAREEGAAVAHFNSIRGVAVAGLATRATGIPTVLHQHGLVSPRFRALAFATMLYVNRTVVVADAITDALPAPLRRGAVTVHNGLDALPRVTRAEGRAALAAACGIDEAALDASGVLVTLSTLTPWKGLHHLVTALARLAARGVPARWAMLGPTDNSTYSNHLTRAIAEAGIGERVHVLGYRGDAVRLLAGADLFVLPTVAREVLDYGEGPKVLTPTEGLPMSILEASAVGVPVVASAVAGVREQVEEGATGLLVPPGDAGALASAIERALADAALRGSARRLGPELVRRGFLAEESSRKLAAVLRSAAGRGPDPRSGG